MNLEATGLQYFGNEARFQDVEQHWVVLPSAIQPLFEKVNV